MSGRYSKYRKTTGYPYRKGGYKSTISKRSSGNIKAAFEQRDQTEVVLNCNNVISCNFGNTDVYGNTEGDLCRVSAINVFDALCHSQFFGNYAPMYDQLRIDKVKAKITSLQYPSESGQGYQNNISVVTAFDRNGLDEGQFKEFQFTDNNQTSACIGTTIGKDISTYSSALTKNLNFGSTFEVIRYISPMNVQEKSQFVATDSLKYWYSKYDERNNKYVTTFTNKLLK